MTNGVFTLVEGLQPRLNSIHLSHILDSGMLSKRVPCLIGYQSNRRIWEQFQNKTVPRKPDKCFNVPQDYTPGHD